MRNVFMVMTAAAACAFVLSGCAAAREDPTLPEIPDPTSPDNPDNPADPADPDDPENTSADNPPDDPTIPDPDVPPADDPTDPPTVGPPGSACSCDADCQEMGGQAGICVFGVCMIGASAACSAAGSTVECPAGLRCWGLSGYDGSAICWPDCDAFSCSGGCDGDGSCAPSSGMDCDASCGSYCTGGSSTTPGSSPIGGACAAASDCADAGASCYPEIYSGEYTGFVQGYCLVFGCTNAGGSCGTGGTCVAGLASDGSNVCMGDCASGCRTGYTCGSAGYCTPYCAGTSDCPSGYACEGGICGPAPCTPGSCPSGQVCVDGVCVTDVGDGPGTYPGITCSLPPMNCSGGEAYCSELIQFAPAEGVGYIDYPENGETLADQYRSWLRRDVVMMIQYATAKVACLADGWTSGNGMPLGLIDMSEQNGAIPGTSVGSPGHPTGTHTNGFDIDVAYYQTGVSDNRARPICEHTEGGVEAYHCTAPPHLLDTWRSALFLGALFESSNIRVVGCDGQAGGPLDSAITTLCAGGWITPAACSSRRLTYETTDMGYGWYYFHHHHMHVSWADPYRAMTPAAGMECLIPTCDDGALLDFLVEQNVFDKD